MPGGEDEVGAALPGGWRVPKIVAATRWMLAVVLASGPSISRLSVEESTVLRSPPHRTASSQHQVTSLEYAEIRLRTSCLIFIILSFTVEVSRDRAANSLSLSLAVIASSPEGNSCTALFFYPAATRAPTSYPAHNKSLQHIPPRHSQTFVC